VLFRSLHHLRRRSHLHLSVGSHPQGPALVWYRRDGRVRGDPADCADLRLEEGGARVGELTLRPVPFKTGRAAGPTPLNALGDNLVTTTIDKVINWGRSSAMCACASCSGMFNNYAIVQSVDKIVPVDIYVPGCPPRPEALLDAVIKLQRKIRGEPLVARPA